MWKIIGALICVASLAIFSLVITPVSSAQCRNGRCIVHEEVVDPVVVNQVFTPIAIPVIVPAFNFQYVPPIGTHPCVQTPYTEPGQGQTFQDDQIKALAKALLEEMSKQSSPQPQEDEGPPAVPGNPGRKLTSAEAAPFAIGALQKNCAACHTGAGKGGVSLFSRPGILNQSAPWGSVLEQIDIGRMPPRDSQYSLTLQEKEFIHAWLGNKNF